MTSQYYTYLHCKPDGSPFYVGSGKDARCYDFSNRHDNHKKIVENHGKQNIGVFIFLCESKEQARRDEKQLIIRFREDGYELTNIHPAPIYKKIKNTSSIEFNKAIAAQAKKRRAKFYKQHINGKTCAELAREYGVTRQRMSFMLLLAKKDE